VSREEVSKALQEAISETKDEVIRLRVERQCLVPLFLHTRKNSGAVHEKLKWGLEQLQDRLSKLENETEAITRQLEQDWPTKAHDLAPGTKVLEIAISKLGYRFNKDAGDTELLASFVSKNNIHRDLSDLLEDISGTPRTDRSVSAR